MFICNFICCVYNLSLASMIEQERNERRRGAGYLQDCFKLMKIQGNDHELFVPACVQFKIRNFTDVNFENLVAKVNGVLCVNFLIFTQNKVLEEFLLDRLYFNPDEIKVLLQNRRKKIGRDQYNYVPIMFNKDDNIKIPTMRTKEFQIQSFKSQICYRKGGANIKGIRVFHILRKQFSVQIIKNGLWQNFIAPFDLIKLELVLSLQHMDVGLFKYQTNEKKNLNENQNDQSQKNKSQDIIKAGLDKITRLSFNILRIEDPFLRTDLEIQQRVLKMAPMIAYSSEEPFGKYDVVETKLQSYTHDEREFKYEDNQQLFKKQLFQDYEPTQLEFKPFKYVVFKIPLFRYPIADMMTIFIPLWLLSFVSVYIYFQTTEIMNRIVNVAALMIAYAAIQPIVRQNIPQATTITLVDILIYTQLLINILFLCKSITLRSLSDDAPSNSLPIELTNVGYSRWSDPLFIISLVISLANVLVVAFLIFRYVNKRGSYKAKPLPRSVFSISDEENWTLTIMMERAFGRYKQNLIFLK